MGKKTGISWTEKTWNPWRGCKMISPGCANCYMFREQKRYGLDPTVITKTTTWKDPAKWQKEAEKLGVRTLVFTCSWSDWFIEVADSWRPDAWKIIKDCPNLIFQILTKRPNLIEPRLPLDWGSGYENVGLGVSIETNDYNWRADILRNIPAKVRFISAEPLLGSLDKLNLEGFKWLVAGGESGLEYRSMDTEWARQLRDKCVLEKVAFFYKQGSGILPGKNKKLDGQVWEQWPIEWVS